MHWVKSGDGIIDVYGVNHYRLDENKINRILPETRGKKVIYEDEYMGNFTLYYSPVVLDQNFVIVPQVHCYVAESDLLEEALEEIEDHSKCQYTEKKKYYVNNPAHIYEIEGDISIDLARRIAGSWYDHNPRDKYIKLIGKNNDSNIVISISGGACSSWETVINKSGTDEIKFTKHEVFICS